MVKEIDIKSRTILQESILCKSCGNIDIPILTITNIPPNIIRENPRTLKYIIMIARTHPGETYGSWIMKGFINFILSEDPSAKYLRDNFIFKIVPMMNPDGVIAWNTRTCFLGNIKKVLILIGSMPMLISIQVHKYIK